MLWASYSSWCYCTLYTNKLKLLKLLHKWHTDVLLVGIVIITGAVIIQLMKVLMMTLIASDCKDGPLMRAVFVAVHGERFLTVPSSALTDPHCVRLSDVYIKNEQNWPN